MCLPLPRKVTMITYQSCPAELGPKASFLHKVVENAGNPKITRAAALAENKPTFPQVCQEVEDVKSPNGP